MAGNSVDAAANLQLALAAHQAGNAAEAKRLYEKVLRQAPNDVRALVWLSRLEGERGRHTNALRLLDRAVKAEGRSAEALFERGCVLVELKRFADALASYDQALRLDPQNPQILNNRGVVLTLLERHDEALAAFDAALAVRRDYAQAFFNRGNTLWQLRRPAEALRSYDSGLAIKADHAEALYNRGNVLLALRQDEMALASFERALALRPGYIAAWNNAAIALANSGRPADAARALRRLLSIAPDSDYAKGDLLFALLRGCDWSAYDESVRDIDAGIAAGRRVALPFVSLIASRSPARQLKCAQIYASDRCPPSAPLWQGERYDHERIRVAYISADFHDHAIAHLIADFIERHDCARFDLTAVSFGSAADDAMRTRLAGSFERFVDARSMSDREIAVMLRELKIDIAVDLMGYTHESRPGIFAFRPAPIQVSYLGYPGTMGTSCIDYLIADRSVIPEHEQAFYAERIVYLPCYQAVNDLSRYMNMRPRRDELGLPSDAFIFCCFNNNFKISPDLFAVWMRVLGRCEKAVLWLLEDNADALRNLHAAAQRYGIDRGRVIFAPRRPMAAHLARQQLADLFLDTFSYNAHTTARDALYAGVPVLTCRGTTFVGRVAASLLDAAGLPELIAGSAAEYESLAISLATDPTMLATLRTRLEQNRSGHPFFDVDRYRRLLESAFITMWQLRQRHEQPKTFAVAPDP